MVEVRSVLRSIVLPTFNEADYIATMVARAVAAGEQRTDPFEVIVVDNASTDHTVDIVSAIQAADQRVRMVRHKENRLYAASCLTGARESRGARIFIMDSDGQHDPADVWRFDSKLDEGCNLVFGWRVRRAEPLARLAMSRFLLLLARLFIGFDLHDVNCGIRGFDRSYADALEIKHRVNFVNPELFVRARLGEFEIGEAEVVQEARQGGTSSHEFSPRRLVRIFVTVTGYLMDLRRELRRSPLR
jgi:glycosyltransferase involved in cell wall biosynthesis